MEKFVIELIVAIREIKEILHHHTEEIEKLKKSLKIGEKNGSEKVDERLMKLALEGSKNLYMQTVENKLEKKLRELENAVRELSVNISATGKDREIEVTEEHLNKLRKALAE